MRKKFLLHGLKLGLFVSLSLAVPELLGTTNKFGGAKIGKPVAPALVGISNPCGPTVNWHNLSDTGCGGATNPGVVSSVVDRNIDIIGTNALVNGISVASLTCDIVISVTNGDAIITGSGNHCDGVLTQPASLYLYAAAGRTINFNLVNSLIFSGTASGGVPLDLLVTVSGAGSVFFTLGDGQTVSFAPKDAGSGGTFFVEGSSAANSAFVAFANSLVSTTDLPAQVIVGPGL